MKKGRCIIHELAQVISEDVALKAVWLDATHKKVSFAFQDGAETKECRKRLEGIVSQYRPDHDSSCIQDAWQVDCELCDRGVSQPMPANIRLVKMPGAGVLLEKEIALAPSHSFRWHQFHWIHLRPRQIVLPFELTTLTGWKREFLAAIVCGAATLIGFLLEKNIFGTTEQFSNILYSLAYLTGAWFPASHMWGLLRKGIVDVHFLMLCVALGAAFIGHMWEGAILLFLFSLSGALEEMAMANTERQIKSLFKAAPKKAMVLDTSGHEREVAVEQLAVGMVLRVRPGEQFPVDAEVIKGTSSVDESNLTGEAEPIDKKSGDNVFSGTLNLWGSVDCRVLKLAEESVLAKIIRLIQEAQKSKAPAQRFTDKFSTGYTYFILSCSVVMFFVWWKAMGLAPFTAAGGQPSAFYRAMTLLVVASPCALVLSIPSAILAGIAAGAKHGILFRGGVAIEKLAEVTRVALDKTGTLTTGDLQVIEVKSFPPGQENEILKIAASVGHHSTHPVSRAIVRAHKKKNGTMTHAENFKSITGMGLEAFIYENAGDEKKRMTMGRRDIFGTKPWLGEIPLPKPGVTETIVECEGLRGQVLLMDQVREVSAPLLRQLENQGLKVTMLTGDRKEAADLIANHLNVSDIRSSLKPDEKVKIIEQWTKDGEKVAMVGDGVNDAPSLAAAYVAVGMGVRGSDAVLEQADVVLMQDRLENFNYAFNLSKKARRIIYQNLTISLGVIAILAFSALGGMIPLTIGVIGHEGSTVLVVLNSLRLLMSHPALVKSSTN